VLFFIEMGGGRRVHLAECTLDPNAPWAAEHRRHRANPQAERDHDDRREPRSRPDLAQRHSQIAPKIVQHGGISSVTSCAEP
jgi:hypothetical protein